MAEPRFPVSDVAVGRVMAGDVVRAYELNLGGSAASLGGGGFDSPCIGSGESVRDGGVALMGRIGIHGECDS